MIGSSAAGTNPGTTAVLRVDERASLILRTDQSMRLAMRSGKLQISYYSPHGQEIIKSALCDHLEPLNGLLRYAPKGVPLNQLWAEYAGRSTRTCKGKDGPTHITYPATGVMVITGIVGSGILIANGLALASQMSGDGRGTVTAVGDGASNIGAFHGVLNMVSL